MAPAGRRSFAASAAPVLALPSSDAHSQPVDAQQGLLWVLVQAACSAEPVPDAIAEPAPPSTTVPPSKRKQAHTAAADSDEEYRADQDSETDDASLSSGTDEERPPVKRARAQRTTAPARREPRAADSQTGGARAGSKAASDSGTVVSGSGGSGARSSPAKETVAKSRFTGVYAQSGGRYRAQFCHGGLVHQLGMYESEEAAAQAWDRVAAVYRPDNQLNFPELRDAYNTEESRQTVITMMGDRMLLRKPRGRPAAEAKLISPSLAIATMPLTTSSPASAVAVSLPPLAGAAAGAAAVAASPARLPPMAPGGARGASPAKGVHGKGRAGIPRKVLNQYIPPVTTNITTNMTTNTTATVSTPTASPATQETLVATNLTTKADVRPVSVPEYAATPASKPTGGMSAEQRGGVRGLVGMQRVDLAPWGELTEGPPTIDHVGNNSAQHGGIGPQQLVGMHGEGEGKGNGGMGDDNKPLPCSVLLSGGPTTPDRHPAGTAQPMSATAAAAAIRALQVLTTSPPAHATAAAAAAAAQAQAPTQPSSARSSSMSIPVGATSAAGGGGGGGGGSALPEVAVPPLGVNPCMSPSPMQQAQQATTPTHDPAGYAPTMQANPFYASMMAAQQMWQQQGHAGMSMPQGVPMFYMPNPHMPPGAPPTCYWVMAPCPATAPGPMQTMSTMQGMPTMPPQWGPMYMPGMPAPYMVPMQAPMPAETAALSPVPPATGATGAIVRLGSIEVPPPSPRARTLSLGHGSHANLAKLASMDVPPQTPSPRGSTEPATVAADFATHHAMHVTVPAPVMVPGPVPMAPMGMAAPRAEPAASGGPMTLVFPAPAVVEAGPTTQTTHTTSHPPPVAPRQPASDDHNSAATQALQDAFLRQLIDRPDVRGQLVSGAARLHFEGSVAVLTGADGQELFRIVAGGQPLGSA